MSTTNPTDTVLAGSNGLSHQKPPRVAFISGHIDLSQDVFNLHYKDRLDAAISNGDTFVTSNAGGADTMALQYLLSQEVSASRITIYIHTPPAPRRKPGGANETMQRIDQLRTGPEVLESYRQQGLGVRVIDGRHTARNAAMTQESDYDILWVRPDVETKALYGEKYRAERVSGTQKNKDRREQQDDVKEDA